MKNLLNLGKTLNNSELKSISGGCPPGVCGCESSGNQCTQFISNGSSCNPAFTDAGTCIGNRCMWF